MSRPDPRSRLRACGHCIRPGRVGPPGLQQEGRWRGTGGDPGHDHQRPAPRLQVPLDNNGLCMNPLELGTELGGLVPWG